MIQVEPFQLTLIILSIISVLWAIRSSFKSYQKEDSIKSAESALVVERISTLNARHDSLNQRIKAQEKHLEDTIKLIDAESKQHEAMVDRNGKFDKALVLAP